MVLNGMVGIVWYGTGVMTLFGYKHPAAAAAEYTTNWTKIRPTKPGETQAVRPAILSGRPKTAGKIDTNLSGHCGAPAQLGSII